MSTEAVEDYLKYIYTLQREHGKVTTSALAARLGVSPASVSGMLSKLAKHGLVSHRKYQGAVLTPEGQTKALKVIRLHRLAELYLREVLGLPLEEVHAEAHKWEHVLSDKVAQRLDSVLRHPSRDPHGSPIPTADGRLTHADRTPLAQLEAGQAVEVAEVSDHDPELLRYLQELGLLPGARIRILERKPCGGPLTIQVANREYAVGPEVTRHVFVQMSTGDVENSDEDESATTDT